MPRHRRPPPHMLVEHKRLPVRRAPYGGSRWRSSTRNRTRRRGTRACCDAFHPAGRCSMAGRHHGVRDLSSALHQRLALRGAVHGLLQAVVRQGEADQAASSRLFTALNHRRPRPRGMIMDYGKGRTLDAPQFELYSCSRSLVAKHPLWAWKSG